MAPTVDSFSTSTSMEPEMSWFQMSVTTASPFKWSTDWNLKYPTSSVIKVMLVTFFCHDVSIILLFQDLEDFRESDKSVTITNTMMSLILVSIVIIAISFKAICKLCYDEQQPLEEPELISRPFENQHVEQAPIERTTLLVPVTSNVANPRNLIVNIHPREEEPPPSYYEAINMN